jgi:hypothetical protein
MIWIRISKKQMRIRNTGFYMGKFVPESSKYAFLPGEISLKVILPGGGHRGRHQVNLVQHQHHMLALHVSVQKKGKKSTDI